MIVDDKIIGYVLYKMRTINEVRQKCKRLKFSDDYIDEVIDYLIEAGYLDDKRYAQKYVENVMRLKNASMNEIKIDLMKRGVDSSIVDDVVETSEVYDFENTSCEILAQKKYKTTNDVLKVKKYLISKGYTFDAVSKAIDNLPIKDDNWSIKWY